MYELPTNIQESAVFGDHKTVYFIHFTIFEAFLVEWPTVIDSNRLFLQMHSFGLAAMLVQTANRS